MIPTYENLFLELGADRQEIGAAEFAIQIDARSALESTDSHIPITSASRPVLIKVKATVI